MTTENPGKARPSKKKAAKSSNWILWSVLGGGAIVLLLCCGGGTLFIRQIYHQIAGNYEIPAGQSYQQWRTNFQTNLTTHGSSPQEYDFELPPENVTEAIYPSGNLQLKAWLYQPPEITEPAAALIFCHGGFAFGAGDLEACQPAMNRGMVVMAPMLRGENGNPGEFELFFGEVDDVKAAAHWLARQPNVNPQQIYVFGHSVGGGNAAVLSLLDDVPIQHSGSSGGLYPPSVFLGWSDLIPFNNRPEERAARLLLGNIRHMQRPHYAYIGEEDSVAESVALAARESGPDSKLTTILVPGDHFSSFDEALERYLQVIDAER